MNGYKISVIVPAFNESQYIERILSEVEKQNVDEIIVVDDCSHDGTREWLKRCRNPLIKIMYHEKNRGKGAAVRTALTEAGGDIIIIQDADLEYDPKDYPMLLEPIIRGKADVVYGSRFKGITRVLYFWHYMGNNFLNCVANFLYDTTLSDMETCYKVFKKECIKDLKLKSDGWGFDAEITAHFLKKSYRIIEIPISYFGRTYKEGKKIRWVHGFVVLFTLLRCRFSK